MAKETLTVTFQHTRFQKPADDDGLCWGIYVCQETTITGKLDPAICRRDMCFEVVGQWETHARYGKQFKFQSYSRRQPNGPWGTIAFLMQADNVGQRTAERIYDYFGENSIKAVIDRPEKVATDCGIRLDVVQAAGETLSPLVGEAKGKLPLLTLFKGTKLAAKTADRIVKLKWSDAVEKITKNPFVLMQLGGVAFKQADSLRLKLKLPKDMPERVLAACRQTFTDKNDQTWLKPSDVRKPMGKLLELADFNVEVVMESLIDAGDLVTNEVGEGKWYALAHAARTEEYVAAQLRCRLDLPGDDWPIDAIMNDQPDAKGKTLSNHQKGVIIHNMKTGGRTIVLAGSPGTGKTFALAKIIAAFKGVAYCCAPTGKAAQRLSEGLAEYGLEPATTIHRMLKPLPVDGGFAFQVDGGDGGYVEADVIAIDEGSMVNNWLAAAALRGIHPSAYIIIVGDKNQLPPVGAGTLLRDMQELGFKEFTEIQRNQGEIVATCAAIRDDEYTLVRPSNEPGVGEIDPDFNIHLAHAKKDDKKLAKVESIIDDMVNSKMEVKDILKDVQFLTATHKHAHVGRLKLNELLQRKLNPNGKGKHKFYKVGDKIICTENQQIKGSEDEDGKKEFIANGELGYVVTSEERWIEVKMNSNTNRILKVNCGAFLGNGWDLGYCITVHKSQGSEWPIVVTAIGSGYGESMVTCREWIYTAISRAKTCAIIVGTNQEIRDMTKKNRIWQRKSFILEHLEALSVEAKDSQVPVAVGSGQPREDTLDF